MIFLIDRNYKLPTITWGYARGMGMGQKILIGMAAVMGIAAGTLAAGAADIAEAPPAHDWTGAYVGVNAGYAFSDNRTSVDSNDLTIPGIVLAEIGVDELDLDPDGFVGGAQVGYNLQFGSLILGIEADAQYTDVNGSDIASVPDDLFDSEFNARQELRFSRR